MRIFFAFVLTLIHTQLLAIVGYVSNNDDSSVSVVDTSVPSVTTFPVPALPAYMALTIDESKLYLASQSGSISVIDTATNTITTTIPTPGGNPHFVLLSVDGSQVYVGDFNNDTVYAVDVTTDTLTTINIASGGQVNYFAFTPDGSKLYAPSTNAAVAVIDTATNTVDTIIPMPDISSSPLQISITPNGLKAYVVNSFFLGSKVFVIDTVTNTTLPSIPIPTSAGGFSSIINSAGTRLYVTSPFDTTFTNGLLSIIDTTTDTVITTLTLPQGSRNLIFNEDETRIYVSNEFDNSVSVIDTATNTIVTTIPGFNGPEELELTPNGDQVWVVDFNDASVTIFNTSTNTLVGAPIPVGIGPFDIVFLTPPNPQVNVFGVSKQNIFLTQTEIFNLITWEEPVGITPLSYKIFRDPALTLLAGEVPASIREFVDHNRQPNTTYTYFIVAVTASDEFLIGQVEVRT